MRAGHSFVSLPDGRMILFGGHDGYKLLSDLYFYSPDTGKWAQVLRGPGCANLAYLDMPPLDELSLCLSVIPCLFCFGFCFLCM